MQIKMRIAKELSDLIFYCQSVSFKSFDDSRSRPYYVMSSFPEKKAMSLALAAESGGQPLVRCLSYLGVMFIASEFNSAVLCAITEILHYQNINC